MTKIIILIVVFVALGAGFLIGQKRDDPEPAGNNSSNEQSGTTLDLSGQQLKTLPDSVASRTDITTLNLSNNQLTSLPSNIGRLENLEVLNVENNRLESLPAEIGQLKNLKTADFSNNRLKSLPPELGDLTQLKYLNLSGYNSSASDFQEIKSKLSDTEVKI